MQVCPFCQQDCADLKLIEGRCPRCGGIIQWSDDQIDSSTTPPEIGPGKTESSPVTTNERFRLPDDGGTIVFPPDWNLPLSSSFKSSDDEQVSDQDQPSFDTETADLSSVAQPLRAEAQDVESAATADSEPDKIEKLWRRSISHTNNRMATLKGETKEGTVTDTVFSIQPREIRSPSTDQSEDDRPVDYELLEVIGQGGVGVVYSGRQASIDRSVAIKMLRDEYRHRQDHRDKFLAEAVLTGELDHPNIVPIYDLGRSNSGELFYSMKNVIGTPWDRVINNKSLRENLDVLLKVADAVAFAHSRGVVHRDLKPENVMLGSYGEVLVMDWGIALPTAEFRKSSSILRSQAMGGTPAYMAPEMATGPVDSIGTAADVYLLGAILFEMLTGQPPHYGDDVMQCVKNAAQNIIIETNVTGELMEIAIKSMSTIQRRRYRTVQDFQAAIRLYLSHSDSISLSDNAELELAKAIEQKNYQSFSRATFAFEEALAMWPENTPALDGIKRSTLAHAQAALEKGDIDLGLSLLDTNVEAHQTLIGKLERAQRERSARQSRLKLFKQIAIGLSVFIFTAGSIGMAFILYLLADASRLNKNLTQAGKDLAAKVTEAEEARDNARIQEGKANDQRQDAENARKAAELSRLESIAQKQKAEESSYFAEAGLVGASLEQNGFTVAADVLERQALSAAKSKLRHWEWGRHRYLVNGGHEQQDSPVVETHAIENSIESIDCSNDGNWVAVALTSGTCQLWRANANADKPQFIITHGTLLKDLDFDSSGRFLATCGFDGGQSGSIKVWELEIDKEPALVWTGLIDRTVVNSVNFSNGPDAKYLVAGDDHRLAHIWDWRENKQVATFFGHMDQVSAAKFSPDDQLIATACLDGNVRLFDVRTGSEVQRFGGHREPVLCLAFTPSGKQVASAGTDPNILLWDVDPTYDSKKALEDVRKQVKGQQLPPARYVTYKAHSGAVNDIRFSPDSKYMISGSSDNSMCIWPLAPSGYRPESSMRLTAMRKQAQDVLLTSRFQLPDESPEETVSGPTVRPLMKLRGHGGWVRGCCFSPNGQQVYSGSVDRSWRRWDYARYQEQRVMGDRRVSITDAHYSPDGRVIAIAYDDGVIELRSAVDGKLIGTLSEGHEYLTNNARFIGGGNELITAAGDNTLRIWDVKSGSQLAVVSHAGHAAAMAVSGDGKHVAAAGDDEGVYLAELASVDVGRRIRTRQQVESNQLTFTEPTAVTLSHDGHWLFVGTKSGQCEVWDAQTGALKHQIRAHAESVIAAFSLPQTPGGSTADAIAVVSISSDGTVAWWDMLTGKELPQERLRHRAVLTSASLSADGRYLATSATLDRGQAKVWLWDLATGQSVATRDLPGQFVQQVSMVTNDVVHVTTSNLDTSVKQVWSWGPAGNQWKVAIDKPLGNSAWGAIATPDNTGLLVFGGKGARLWRIADAAEVMQFRPSSSVYCLDFSHDSRLLAAGNEDGSITLWNIETQKSERKLLGIHRLAVNDVDFSHQDNALVSCGADGRIALWDLERADKTLEGKLAGSGIQGTSVRFSPDGSMLAIGCDDRRIRVHETTKLNQLFKLEGHEDAVTCVDWSPEGRWLVSGSQDKSIRLWSIQERNEVSRLIGHLAPIHSIQFSNDGLRLLSSSQDSTIKMWDLDNLESLTERIATASGTLESETGEVLSLQYHLGPVTSAEFSPAGLDVLSAGADGVAVVWPAQRVPPALRLSQPALSYTEAKPVPLDRLAQITQVGSQDLYGARLTVKRILDEGQTTDPTEKVSLDLSDGQFTLDGNQIWLSSNNQSGLEIAELKQVSLTELELVFSANCTHGLARQLVRRIAYARTLSSDAEAAIDRRFQWQLVDARGQSGNAQPEILIVR